MRSPCTLLAGMTNELPRSPRCPLVTNRQGRPAEAACRRCAAATNRLQELLVPIPPPRVSQPAAWCSNTVSLLVQV